jgi:GNAT superfamily N-acetyltransferase
MGRAFVDDPAAPRAYRIVIGPFWYFAGEARMEMIRNFPAYNLLMPSSDGWVDAARSAFGDALVSFPRYQFSTEKLSARHLENLLEKSIWNEQIDRVDKAMLDRFTQMPENPLDLSDFDSGDDFLERGIAYVCMGGDTPMGIAYSSLVWSRGIEVSIFVNEEFRKKGVATALAGSLTLESLRRGLRPNWDAANPESCKLAEKLGFVFTESYDSYYHKKQSA